MRKLILEVDLNTTKNHFHAYLLFTNNSFSNFPIPIFLSACFLAASVTGFNISSSRLLCLLTLSEEELQFRL